MKWTKCHIELALQNNADLSGVNLFNANLSRANLSRADLSRANLFGANLFGANLFNADLFGANLSRANLSRANLSGANLSRADLSRANLSGVNLSGVNLSRANLSGADLFGADLSDANLSKTCLDPALTTASRKAAKLNRQRGIIGYRTATSQNVGDNTYTPGHTYVANALSWDSATACHPGIYFYPTLEQLKNGYGDRPAVKVYARAGEYTVTAKGAFRAARVRVLEAIE